MPLLKLILKLIFLPLIAIILLAGIIQLSSMFYFARHTTTLKKADLLIVFPGDKSRIPAAFSLAEKDLGKNMAIIGTTPQQLRRKVKKYTLPPATQLIDGGTSCSTFEDVYTTNKIIQQHTINSLILVTSSYHMPRAFLLLKTFNFASNTKLQIQLAPINTTKDHTLTKKIKLYYNESMKLWGSLAEMAIYRFTGTLPSKIERLNTIDTFLHTYFLFDV